MIANYNSNSNTSSILSIEGMTQVARNTLANAKNRKIVVPKPNSTVTQILAFLEWFDLLGFEQLEKSYVVIPCNLNDEAREILLNEKYIINYDTTCYKYYLDARKTLE